MGKFTKVKFLPVVTTAHTCPVANVEFIGACANVGCPANIYHKRSNASGCFFEKGQANIIDVARYNKLSTHETKRRYQRGMRKLEKFVAFYNFVQNLREFTNVKCCPNCGLGNTHNLACLKTDRCQKRQKLYTKYISRFPFNVEPLQVTRPEFWAAITSPKLTNVFADTLLQRVKTLTESIDHA